MAMHTLFSVSVCLSVCLYERARACVHTCMLAYVCARALVCVGARISLFRSVCVHVIVYLNLSRLVFIMFKSL